MYQHERSLVQKYKNRPFVLIGVNTDDKSALKGIIQRNNLTWSSWADGHFGPICKQWGIQGFPTIFLIDDEGKIRETKGEDTDLLLEKLVEAAERRNAKQHSR